MTTTPRGAHGWGQGPSTDETVAEVVERQCSAVLSVLSIDRDLFARAVRLLHPGPIVCSGVGKSGHVARRAAAVLSNLGTPAVYLHPSDALHGELGIVSPAVAFVAISRSGRTGDLTVAAVAARRMGLSVLAITCDAASPLALEADVVLECPRVEEAGPVHDLPLACGAQMAAVCDVLAVLMARHGGFTPADYRTLHPAGLSTASRADP